MKYLGLLILTMVIPSIAYSDLFTCTVDYVDDLPVLHVKMPQNHPKHMVIHPPYGPTIWLVGGFGKFHLYDEPEFKGMTEFTLTKNTLGQSWDDGRDVTTSVFPVIGEYELYVADNIETEPDNTYWIRCNFEIEK